MIHIVADSTSDLSPELIEQFGITIIPLHVILDDREYLDGVNITTEEIYRWSDENKKTPKTSAPGLEDIIKVFNELTENGDEVIAFSISSQMSTTNNVMHLAAEETEKANRISVIDSENLSTGIGLLVVKATELVKEGKNRAEIVKTVEALRPYVRASFVIDTLVYLYRGGRCNGVAALVGGMLKLHPRINVNGGAMEPGQKYRGKMSHVIMEYVKEMEPKLLRGKKEHVFITHPAGMDEETVRLVREYLESLHHFDAIHETCAGSVISSHCGPGTLGVLFIEEP